MGNPRRLGQRAVHKDVVNKGGSFVFSLSLSLSLSPSLSASLSLSLRSKERRQSPQLAVGGSRTDQRATNG